MSYVQDEIDDAIGKRWRIVIVVIAVLCAIYMLSSLVFGLWPLSVARDLAHKVVNATAIVSNYEWYYDQYEALKAQLTNINSLPKDDPNRLGMLMVLNGGIAEYNAKSREITRSMWKGQDLPQTVTIDTLGGLE